MMNNTCPTRRAFLNKLLAFLLGLPWLEILAETWEPNRKPTDRDSHKLTQVLEGVERVLYRLESDQSWYWTDQWQATEAEAEQQIERGDYVEFDDIEEAIKFHDSL